MENSKDVSPCVVPGYICETHKERKKPCKVNLRLSEMQRSIDDQLRAINLKDLLSE
jgi:DNA-binding IscR family transcriptional regulator